VQVHSGEASSTTVFGHGYDRSGARELTLLDRAPDLSPDDVPEEWRRVGVLHVAPVMAEVSADVVSVVRADFVGVTAQGWLRRVGANGRVAAGPWAVPEGIVRRSDAVVVSDEDLRGSPSLSSGLAALAESGPVVVLTHGAEGATAWHAGRVWRQAACPARAVDPTGAGDTFAAALFVRLWEGADLRAALGFAAAAAAFAVEMRGAGGLPARNRIERRGSEAPASGPATATEGGAAGC
jgi:sugar/nucleoside kinase (ribokinase family)